MSYRSSTILIPYGGLNGDIDQCLYCCMNQTVPADRIVVLVDSSNDNVLVDDTTIKIARKLGANLSIIYDRESTSIIDMRLKLLKHVSTKLAVFIDSDILVKFDAMEQLHAVMADKYNPIFAEGMRIEVGGRKNDQFSLEAKQVSENNENNHIYCGDTALLMLDMEAVKESILYNGEEVLRTLFDKRGIGGSDFAMTVMMLAATGGVALAAPKAIGFHLARPSKGYWQNYAASDHMLQTSFITMLKTNFGANYAEKANHLIKEVFSKQ